MTDYSAQFSMNCFRLDGKVAMITGANQGLGFAYAVALAKAGADIFIPHFTVRRQLRRKAARWRFCRVT